MSKPYWQQISETMINVAMAEQRRLVRKKEAAERREAALAKAAARRHHELFGLEVRAKLKVA